MKRGGRRGVNPIFQAEKGRQEEKVWDEDEVLHRHVEWAAKLGDAAALYQLRLSALTEPGNPERRVEPERGEAVMAGGDDVRRAGDARARQRPCAAGHAVQ